MKKPKEYFDPKSTEFPYPAKTDQHYLVVKKDDGTVFDENYPYVDKSKKFLFKKRLTRVGVCTIGFLAAKIRYGLRVYGRENLKKHKEVLKKGVMSVSNHVLMWDYLCLMYAIRPFNPYHPSWDVNCRGENKNFIRMVGGIPVPKNDRKALMAFSRAFEELLNEGNWVHFYAEGSMWEYYAPIRPFKKGAMTYAVRTAKPVLPIGFSYRQPKGLQKLFHKRPLVNVTIGEPIFPDESLPKAEAVEKLMIAAHQAVCRLAGINPEDNLYLPVFCDNDRVDYYFNPKAVPLKKDQR